MPSRVLLITPEFYGIEKLIKSILEKSGSEVIWLENKILTLDYHGTKSKFKFFRKLYFFLFFPHVRYLKKQFKNIGNIRFDILFSINGNIICHYLFKKLKSQNPDLYSVLYLWDAFSMYSWSHELKYFNKVFTFDRADSEKYGIEYKPNFFVRSPGKRNPEIEYDLFFAGKFNSSRLILLDKILSEVANSGIKYFVKLWPAYKIFFHNYLIYNLLKKINFKDKWIVEYLLNYEAIEGKIKREYLTERSLGYEEMQNYLECSNVILDLPFQGQTGFTHRLIEALAKGKKVITTNSNIKKELFYNSEQIHITDIQNPEIDCNWIREKSSFRVDSYFLDLELSSWLKSITNVEVA
jgi:hypothetical protein